MAEQHVEFNVREHSPLTCVVARKTGALRHSHGYSTGNLTKKNRTYQNLSRLETFANPGSPKRKKRLFGRNLSSLQLVFATSKRCLVMSSFKCGWIRPRSSRGGGTRQYSLTANPAYCTIDHIHTGAAFLWRQGSWGGKLEYRTAMTNYHFTASWWITEKTIVKNVEEHQPFFSDISR